jgi:hypothetical protein
MVLLVSAIAFATSGCVASHTWAPGPHQSAASFTETSGRCKLASMGANSGDSFAYAQGSPQFVGSYLGAVTIASAIGSHNRQQNTYNACMEAAGFVEADSTTSSTNAKDQIAAIKQQKLVCLKAVRAKPVYAALQPHFSDPEIGPTLAQMADTSFPTPEEAKLFAPYLQEMRVCTDQVLGATSKFMPAAYQSTFVQASSDSYAVLDLLQNRQISWGDAAKRGRIILEQTAAKLRALGSPAVSTPAPTAGATPVSPPVSASSNIIPPVTPTAPDSVPGTTPYEQAQQQFRQAEEQYQRQLGVQRSQQGR